MKGNYKIYTILIMRGVEKYKKNTCHFVTFSYFGILFAMPPPINNK